MPADNLRRPGRDTLLISLPEAARRLGIDLGTVRAEAGAGRLPTVVLGKRRFVPAAKLTAYVDSLAGGAK